MSGVTTETRPDTKICQFSWLLSELAKCLQEQQELVREIRTGSKLLCSSLGHGIHQCISTVEATEAAALIISSANYILIYNHRAACIP